MKSWICRAIAIGALLASTPGWGAESAPNRAGAVEVGPFLGGYVFDKDLRLKNSAILGARGGFWLSDALLAELSLAGARTEEKDGGDRRLFLQGHADLLYHFKMGWGFEPFVAAGLGAARYDADSQGGKDVDFLLNYGVGARYWITDQIAARVDLRQPITFGSPKANFLYTAGVSFLFGGAAPAPLRSPTATLTVNPTVIRQGQSTTLSWSTGNANEVYVDNVGTVGAAGSRTMYPASSTTYRLKAKGPGGAVEVEAPVTVTMPSTPTPTPTATLTASPNPIERGQATTLTWATQDATDVSLEGIGPVGATGFRTVAPRDSTTYRLTATGPGGRVIAAIPVTVNAPPPLSALAPTATLTATPATVKWGDPTTLSWFTRDATDVSIEGLGPVATTGRQNLTPIAATTYRLTARGPGGMTEATASVAVELPQKVCISLHIEFDFDKSDIKPQYHEDIGDVSKFMKTYPKTTAVIEGHTDNVGTRDYNEKLSLRRADAVVAYLVEKYQIEANRLSSQGYGFSKPVAENTTAEGRRKNRRIDAVIDCAVVR